MTRIGVVSDTHLTRPDAAFSEAMRRALGDVSLILHAGDITGPAVLDAFDWAEVIAVAGNMDQGAWAADLPAKRVVTVEGRRIGLTHGWGAKTGLMGRVAASFAADNVDCVVFGHSHQPTNVQSGGVLYFNPGTAAGGRVGGTVGILLVGQDVRGTIIRL